MRYSWKWGKKRKEKNKKEIQLDEAFSKNLKIESLCDLASPLLGISPKERKAGLPTDIRAPRLLAVLFPVAKRVKQSRSPSTDG